MFSLPRSYANVTSTLALFLALGGVGWAAATLPRNSVGTAQLKRSAVTGAKVRSGAVTGRHVKDRSLSARDFGGALPAGATGAPGPQGPAGPQGAPGAQGAPGISGYVVVREYSAFNSDDVKDVYATCPAGTRAIGGGALVNQPSGHAVALKKSLASPPDERAWYAQAFETTAIAMDWNVRADAICAVVAPAPTSAP